MLILIQGRLACLERLQIGLRPAFSLMLLIRALITLSLWGIRSWSPYGSAGYPRQSTKVSQTLTPIKRAPGKKDKAIQKDIKQEIKQEVKSEPASTPKSIGQWSALGMQARARGSLVRTTAIGKRPRSISAELSIRKRPGIVTRSLKKVLKDPKAPRTLGTC